MCLPRQTSFPKPGVIVLDGGDELFFEESVLKFYQHVLDDWRSSEKPIALYFGCSFHKPFSKSFIHRKTIKMLEKHNLDGLVQQFIVSEPLVICPRELETKFPAANYNFPPDRLGKTGREEFVRRLKHFLWARAANFYKYHVSFMPNHHKDIFKKASENLLRTISVPYNMYQLPKLLKVLEALKKKCRR